MTYTLPNLVLYSAVNAARVGGMVETCTEGGRNLYWNAVGNCAVFTVKIQQNMNPKLIIRY